MFLRRDTIKRWRVFLSLGLTVNYFPKSSVIDIWWSPTYASLSRLNTIIINPGQETKPSDSTKTNAQSQKMYLFKDQL